MNTSEKFVELQSLQMHDNINGQVTSLGVSFDNKYLFSTGSDGNIFVYKCNLKQSVAEYHNDQMQKIDWSLLAIPQITDIFDSNSLSLEQEKQKAVANEKSLKVNTRKAEILEIIGQLKNEFDQIKKRNYRLPESMQLTSTALEIDQRITEDLQHEFDQQMEMVRKEQSAEIKKIQLFKSKIDEVLLSNIECWPISLLGIR